MHSGVRRLFVIAVFLLTFGGVFVEGAALRRLLVLYPRNRRIASLHSLKGVVPSSAFSILAAISLKYEMRDVPRMGRELSSDASQEAEAERGWKRNGEQLVWMPATMDHASEAPPNLSLALSLRSDGAGSVLLREADELRVDYHDASAINPVNIAAEMWVEARDLEPGVNGTERFPAATPVFMNREIDVSSAKWVEKGLGYRFRRLFGLSPDDSWRYVRWKGGMVLQKRMHEPLANVHGLDLLFRPGTPVGGVNLRVTDMDDNREGNLIALGEPSGEDASRGFVHVDVKELLNGRLPGVKRAFLQEIVVYLPGLSEEILNDMPLRKLVYSSLEPEMKAPPGVSVEILPVRVEGSPSNGGMIAVDLRPLHRFNGARLKSCRIVVVPGNPREVCGVRLDRIRLVRFEKEARPVFIQKGQEVLRRWGGPYLKPTGRPGRVEWPVVDAYCPFNALNVDAVSPASGPGEEEYPRQSFSILPDKDFEEDVLQTEGGREYSIRQLGFSLAEGGTIRRLRSGADGVVVEGLGRWLEVKGPFPGRLDSRSRFYLGIPEGADSVRRIRLTLKLLDGKTVVAWVTPNQAAPLGVREEGVVKSAVLRLELVKTPFRLKLGEMAVFRPVEMTWKEAFSDCLPVDVREELTPERTAASPSGVFNTHGGVLSGVLSKEQTLSWTTLVRRNLDWIRGMRLVYNVPSEIFLCGTSRLHLDLRWKRGRMTRDILLDRPAGDVFIPWAQMMNSRESVSPFGDLESIDWKVQMNDGVYSEFPGSIVRFAAALEGKGMRSLKDDLEEWPVAAVGEESIPPIRLEGLPLSEFLEQKEAWFSFNRGISEKIVAADGVLTPVDNPFFKLDSVVLEPLQPLPSSLWLQDSEAAPFRWRDVLFPLFVAADSFFLFWLVFKRWRNYCGDVFAELMDRSRPWIHRMKERLLVRRFLWHAAFPVWVIVSLALYFDGFRNPAVQGENYPFSFGGLAAVMAFFCLFKMGEMFLKKRCGKLSGLLYGRAGSPFFVGALLALVLTGALLGFYIAGAAEQLFVSIYYFLIFGVISDLWGFGASAISETGQGRRKG